jgi:hypothetical protein
MEDNLFTSTKVLHPSVEQVILIADKIQLGSWVDIIWEILT